jgi:polysaccharide biosynthesis protein PslG
MSAMSGSLAPDAMWLVGLMGTVMTMWRGASARIGRGMAAVGVLVLTLVAQACGPASARPHVTSTYFGMHAPTYDTAWPDRAVGAVNLTTNGVYWPQLQTTAGSAGFDFSRLNSLVRQAHAHHAQPLLVLGQTPTFASTAPDDEHVLSTVPRMNAWRAYVAAVVARYKTRLDYEIWPEPNAAGNWQGSRKQLAELVVAAAKIIHKTSPKAVVVSPGLVIRKGSQQRWMSKFFATRVGGVRVGHYVDAVGIDAYPVQHGTPEDSAALLKAAHHILVKHKVTAPLWNVEINYGVVGGHAPVAPFATAKQASYVVRTYLLNAANGVKRVYWLGWADIAEVAIQMVQPDQVTPTAAGRAFATVRDWMAGQTAPSCVLHRATHVYACQMVRAGHASWVYWTTRGTAKVRVPKGSRHVATMDGDVRDAPKRVTVTSAPIRVYH